MKAKRRVVQGVIDLRQEKLADLLKNVPPERVRDLMVKTETIQMRVTAVDKDEIKKAAQKCRLSVSEYLIRSHQVIAQRLRD